MKGRVHKTENGWMVEVPEVNKEFQLHPDDVFEMEECSKVFDNILARLAEPVDVKLVVHQKLTGAITYAKVFFQERLEDENRS